MVTLFQSRIGKGTAKVGNKTISKKPVSRKKGGKRITTENKKFLRALGFKLLK